MQVTAQYLREQAHYCVALARACPHRSTSQALEALGVELMEKAAEVEKSSAIIARERSDER
jgi:hypothetical protein